MVKSNFHTHLLFQILAPKGAKIDPKRTYPFMSMLLWFKCRYILGCVVDYQPTIIQLFPPFHKGVDRKNVYQLRLLPKMSPDLEALGLAIP